MVHTPIKQGIAEEGWSGMNSQTVSNPQFNINPHENKPISSKKTLPETYVSFLTSNAATASSSKNATTKDIEDISKTLKWNNSMSVNNLEHTTSTLLDTPKGKYIFRLRFTSHRLDPL